MDRNDGQDIRHYDSVEAIDAMQDSQGSPAAHVPAPGEPDPIRDANDITADEMESDPPVSDSTLDAAEYGSPTAGTTADTYGETTADLDFDPGSDELGMGTDESDNMISDE